MPLLSTFLGSTRFLLTRGSPSALSTACRLDAAGGPKYAASSFGFFLACGRDLEPEGAAPETEPLADMAGIAMFVVNVNNVPSVHEDCVMTAIPTRSWSTTTQPEIKDYSNTLKPKETVFLDLASLTRSQRSTSGSHLARSSTASGTVKKVRRISLACNRALITTLLSQFCNVDLWISFSRHYLRRKPLHFRRCHN